VSVTSTVFWCSDAPTLWPEVYMITTAKGYTCAGVWVAGRWLVIDHNNGVWGLYESENTIVAWARMPSPPREVAPDQWVPPVYDDLG
jgi:hypothetical protein